MEKDFLDALREWVEAEVALALTKAKLYDDALSIYDDDLSIEQSVADKLFSELRSGYNALREEVAEGQNMDAQYYKVMLAIGDGYGR